MNDSQFPIPKSKVRGVIAVMAEFIYRHRAFWIFSAMLILVLSFRSILDFTAMFICRHWMIFCLLSTALALILSFQKNQTLVRIGKSSSCAAFLLFNWAIFYVDAYRRYLPNISDVWRWFPAVIFSGIFIICALAIWKPFDGKYIRKYVFILVGFMVALTVGTVMTWEYDTFVPGVFGLPLPAESIFEEFWRILNHPSWYPYSSWVLRITSIIIALASFLSYMKNQIATRIGRSLLIVTFLFLAWIKIIFGLQLPAASVWECVIGIIFLVLFLITQFFMWRGINFRAGYRISREKIREIWEMIRKKKFMITGFAIGFIILLLFVRIAWVMSTPRLEIVAVTVNSGSSFAIDADDNLWAWGRNDFGQLGDGTSRDRRAPVKIMDSVESVVVGSSSAMAIRTDGSLWGWGSNWQGQLGDGTNINRYRPVRVMNNVVSVSIGRNYTLAIRSDGSLWAWGFNRQGQLGDGTTINRHEPVKIMDDVIYVSNYVLGDHSAVIRSDGSLWAWGSNRQGQLGDGTTINRYEPIKIMDDVADVILGRDNTMVIRKNGSLWGWGSNWNNRIDSTPVAYHENPVMMLTDVASFSLGSTHSMVIKTDGSLWGWGNNNSGQVGDGTRTRGIPRSIGRRVKIMDDVVAVSAIGAHTFAFRSDGSLWAWGRNMENQLGDGTNEMYRSSPVKIMDDVVTVSSDSHTLAIRGDGSLWAWGRNYFGQLGDGTRRDRISPVRIIPVGIIP